SRSQNADNTYSPDGTVRTEGFRLGAAGRLARGWRVYGGYTRLDARIVAAIAPGTQGKTPLNTPRDSATLWTTYEVGHHLEIGGGAAYLSRRYLTNLDTVQVPAYARVDATLAWRRPRYDLRLNVFNLLDARYYDALIPSDGGRAVPGAGRTAMISLVYRP
ncbi:MAG: TonB-dependent receptor, partial [Caulobacteraceae bacterium]|nr:TonB-dependent receptor [Caulobacteraceae bacterium]